MDKINKIEKIKQDLLSKIKIYADKGDFKLIQKYPAYLPEVESIVNKLSELEFKIDSLEKVIKNESADNLMIEYTKPNLTTQDKAKIWRNELMIKLKNKGIILEHHKGVMYRDIKKRLVGIAYSGEKYGSWFLGLPDTDLKIVILLCLNEANNDVYTIILPEDFCSKNLANMSKSNNQLKFRLFKKHNDFILYTKSGNKNVSQYINYFDAFNKQK